MLSHAHGNSSTADKLKTARNIKLQGAVSGNASFDGSNDVTINVTQANIAVITGVLKPDTISTQLWKAIIPYPDGYTQGNSVVMSLMIKGISEAAEVWSLGSVLNTSNTLAGTVPSYVRMKNNEIEVACRHVVIDKDMYPSVATANNSISYKLILMKIS